MGNITPIISTNQELVEKYRKEPPVKDVPEVTEELGRTIIDRLVNNLPPDTRYSTFDRDVIIQCLAMRDMGYTYKSISNHFNGSPSVDTIASWVRHSKLKDFRIPDKVKNEIEADMAKLARNQAKALKRRFDGWTIALGDHMFEIGALTSTRLRNLLAQDKMLFDKEELANIRQLTGTLHYTIRDVSLLAGEPDSRNESISVNPDEVDLPNIPDDELADRFRKLADALDERANEGDDLESREESA